LHECQLGLQTGNLLLQGEDVTNAAIDGISQSSLCLVGYGDNCLAAFWHGDMQQKLGYVARPENLMNCGEMCGAFIKTEVWSEHAAFRAFPSQKPAGSARRSTSVHCAGFELPTPEIWEGSSVLLPGVMIFASSLWPQSRNSEGGGADCTGWCSLRRPAKGRGQGGRRAGIRKTGSGSLTRV